MSLFNPNTPLNLSIVCYQATAWSSIVNHCLFSNAHIICYWTILINLAVTWLFCVFDKSQKFRQIEKKLNPGSKKIGMMCDCRIDWNGTVLERRPSTIWLCVINLSQSLLLLTWDLPRHKQPKGRKSLICIWWHEPWQWALLLWLRNNCI